MDLIVLLITFGLIGGISRGAIVIVQWYRRQTTDQLIKLSENPIINQIWQRLNLALQMGWVFIAFLIMSKYEDSLLSVHALIISISISSPVIVYSGMRWIRGDDKWSAKAFAAGTLLVVVVSSPLSDYMYESQFIGTLSCIISIFLVFNLIGSCQTLLAYAGHKKSIKS